LITREKKRKKIPTETGEKLPGARAGGDKRAEIAQKSLSKPGGLKRENALGE